MAHPKAATLLSSSDRKKKRHNGFLEREREENFPPDFYRGVDKDRALWVSNFSPCLKKKERASLFLKIGEP